MKKKIQTIIMIVIQLGVGFCCGLFGAMYFESFLDFASMEDIILMMISFMLYFYLGTFIHIIVHECGHLIFGLLTGYQFVSIRFGSLMLIEENGKLQFKHFSLAGTGGQCLLAPPDYNDGNYPALLYNLGGCLANLIASFISVFFLVLPIGPWLDAFFIIFALCGIGSALINGIPMQNSQIANDGANIVSLKKDPYAKRAFWIQMKVNELNSRQMRLKDMPDELFYLSNQPNFDSPLCSAIEIFKAQRFLDKLDFEAAKQQINMLLEHSDQLMGIHKHILINDFIYLHLIEKDITTANQWMNKEHKKMRKAMKTNIAFIRTQIVYDLALNKMDAVEKQQQLFDKAIKKYPYKTDIESEQELIDIATRTILTE